MTNRNNPVREPEMADIFNAQKTISKYLPPTPLFFNPVLSRLLDSEIYIKYENHQPTTAFKVRGGINLLSNIYKDVRKTGVVTASTGNHGQSISYASKTFGVPATIFGPENNIPDKTLAMEALGAEVILKGRDFDEARLFANELAEEKGLYSISPANDYRIIAGVATIGLEIIKEVPDPDYVFIPLGGGSSLAGNGTVFKTIRPKTKILGVQAEKAPAFCQSFKAGKIINLDYSDTFADGLATRQPFELTYSIIKKVADNIMLVSEEEMEKAIVLIYKATHNIAEGAGASTTAAALKLGNIIKGKKCVLILSGGNLQQERLLSILKKWDYLKKPEDFI